MNSYMSISRRDTHHFDIGNGVRRVFCIRGEPGEIVVRDEREGPTKSKDLPIFKTASAAIMWCADEMLMK